MKKLTALISYMFMCIFMWAAGNNTSEIYTYEFTEQIFYGKEAKILNGISWTVTHENENEYYGYDTTSRDRGQQIGSSTKNAYNLILSTDEINGIITSIKISTAGTSDITAKIGTFINGKQFGQNPIEISDENSEYEFQGSAKGKIELKWMDVNKGLYVKKIEITYAPNPQNSEYIYEFAEQVFSGKETKTLNGVSWTMTHENEEEYYGYDATSRDRGQQIGSSSKNAYNLIFSTNDFNNTISSIKVITAGTSDVTAKIGVYVNGEQFGQNPIEISDENAEYEFQGSAKGKIELRWTDVNKGLYIKRIKIIENKDVGIDICSESKAIKFDGNTIFNNNQELLHVYNSIGHLIRSSYSDIDTRGLHSGIYIVRTKRGVLKVLIE